jgi:hypothetical protein
LKNKKINKKKESDTIQKIELFSKNLSNNDEDWKSHTLKFENDNDNDDDDQYIVIDDKN